VPTRPQEPARRSVDPEPDEPTGRASGLRRAVETVSLPLLVRLVRLPRAVPFLVLLGLLVGALLIEGPLGAVAAGVVVLVVLWLLYLGWPRLSRVERLGRSAVLLMAVSMCLVQLFPRD
jgi:hypothetical protein